MGSCGDLKVVILAGGLGTRLMEETAARPKPMVEIGGRPILWHIMKYYASYGFLDFVICLGYRGYMIKEYFANYLVHNSDVTIDLKTNQIEVHNRAQEPWRVTLVDTGAETMTGGRLKRVRPFVAGAPFFCTYGDGLSNVDLAALRSFHESSGKLATLTAVQPPGRYGALELDGSQVRRFREKPSGDGGWVNGGYFVLDPRALDYIEGDATHFEREPLEKLASDGELRAFEHAGFWLPMDTLRDRVALEALWDGGNAPWARWSGSPPA
jgi:glucose-1-phosphate cytidylyltransferase